MKSFLKDIVYTLVRILPRSPGAVILCYHSIGENDRRFTVTPAAFEAQLRWLRDNKFNVVSLDALAAYRAKGSIPPRTVCITFDDGYLDNYTIAFPLLKKYGFPATVFITTGDLQGVAVPTIPPLPKMSEAQLKELDASGVILIASHSVTHPKFTQIDNATAAQELGESKAYIERLLGKVCLHFAYPKGRNNAQSREAVKNAGISFAYGTFYGKATPSSNDFALPRNGIDRTTTLAQFKGIALAGRLS